MKQEQSLDGLPVFSHGREMLCLGRHGTVDVCTEQWLEPGLWNTGVDPSLVGAGASPQRFSSPIIQPFP